MGSKRRINETQVTTTLAYRDGRLCVLAEHEGNEVGGATPLRLWYPIREAGEAEVAGLIGRPVTEVDVKEGIYVDEEGAVFQLADKGETKPIADGEGSELEQLLSASVKNGNGRTHRLQRPAGQRGKRARKTDAVAKAPAFGYSPTLNDTAADDETPRLNLRRKLAEVRRRIGYVQKRGFNERNNYSYVTAADLAGAVGDILAELGVVIVPSLESIAYEAGRAGGEISRSAQVVMSYTFTDVDTGEAITAKVAGQGLDSGDKAPYKAMTGALKYALLQSFLLATGDDPEDERIAAGNGDHPISAEQVRELKSLIDETGTELDRVLAYYRVNSLEEMRESSYRRAVELLNRKRAKQTHGSDAYAQG